MQRHALGTNRLLSESTKRPVSRAKPRAQATGTQTPLSNHAWLAQSIGLQRKLVISEPNDQFEQEADRVAEQVMRMPADVQKSGFATLGLSNHGLQRKCACGGTPGPTGECEQCRKKRLSIQRRSCAANQPEQTAVPPMVHDVLRSPGQPLDLATRAFMEPRFGHDFSRVRVHSGSAAEESARSVHAKAYTVGPDIVFGAPGFAPETHEGQWLIAHELTHVVQQSASNSLRSGEAGEKPSIAHAIQQNQQTKLQAVPAPGTADITLETGNTGAGFINDAVHQQICVDISGGENKRCFSFGKIGGIPGVQLPQFSTTWLGWSSLVTGAILRGEIYEPAPVTTSTVASRHTPSAAQGANWLRYMDGTRLGLQDGYSVGRHNCRTFSQWEFRDAPMHW